MFQPGSVQPGKAASNSFGPFYIQRFKDIALDCIAQIFQHQDSLLCGFVGRAVETLGNACSHLWKRLVKEYFSEACFAV